MGAWLSKIILRLKRKSKDNFALHPNKCARLDEIEGATNRTITIDPALSETNLAKCHPQDQSPLFKLPPELRNLIFEFTLLPSPGIKDEGLPYPTSRPAHAISFLHSCRRIWLEANGFSPDHSEVVLWFTDPYAQVSGTPLEIKKGLERYFRRLTPRATASLQHLKIVVDIQFLLEGTILPILAGAVVAWPPRVTFSLLCTQFFGFSSRGPILKFARQASIRSLTIEIVFSRSKRVEVNLLMARLLLQSQALPADDLEGWRYCGDFEMTSPVVPSVRLQNTDIADSRYSIISASWERMDSVVGEDEPSTAPFVHCGDSLQSPGDEEVLAVWQARWERQRSLLQFLDTPPRDLSV